MTQTRWGSRRVAAPVQALLVLGMLTLTASAPAAAAESEVREFTIHVDGKHAGYYQMTITSQGDGVSVMSGKADVRLSVLLHTYIYHYDGTEVWKHGRLHGLRSSCNDDGKRYQVTAERAGEGLRVHVNGREHHTPGDAWTTSYWRLPEARQRNHPVPLLEADTGKEINGHLHYVGSEDMVVGGQRQPCVHYRVTGTPSPVDLWYDGKERLVRQDYVEDGHRTILQVTSIRR
jgi:hypothetical protein